MKRHIQHPERRGFTLIELLVVISIIALLTAILVPSVRTASSLAKGVKCLSNLKNLGVSAGLYQINNQASYWPYQEVKIDPSGNVRANWYWGRFNSDGSVDTTCSAFMQYLDYRLDYLWCPMQPWGSYVPQAGAKEPTTNFGYNGKYLSRPGQWKRTYDIKQPTELFVFNDSAIWNLGGSGKLQNSTYLEPVTGNAVQMPTTHFRHMDKTQALCADGHAASFDSEGWAVDDETKLGFVGTDNFPHYEQD